MPRRGQPRILLKTTIENYSFKVTENPSEPGGCIVWLHNLLEHNDFEVIGKFSKFDKKAMMAFLTRYSTNHQLRRLIELRKFKRKLENLSPHVFKEISRLNTSQKKRAFRHLFNLETRISKDELLEKKRRLMVKRFHPDVGGDHLSMVVINQAYDYLHSHIDV